MSTKISKGARLHLLRTVERLEYPLRTIRVGEVPSDLTMDATRSIVAKAHREGAVFVLPPWITMTISVG